MQVITDEEVVVVTVDDIVQVDVVRIEWDEAHEAEVIDEWDEEGDEERRCDDDD